MPPIRKGKPPVGPPAPPVKPPLPPGPPRPPGPIVITPGGPPPPPEPLPTQYQPGMWSDGWVVVRQHEGSLVLDGSNGMHVLYDVRNAGSSAADIVNQILGVVGLAARATTVEPWPVRYTAQKASKEKLMGTDLSQDEKLDIFAATMESVAKDVRDIKAALVTYQAEQTEDHWAAAFGLTEEPAGLDVPLDVFTPERAALYAVFERSVINGSRTFVKSDCVTLASTLTFGTAIDETGQKYLDLCVKYSVDRDVAIYSLLTGLVNPYEGGLGARLERDVSALAGTYKPETLSDGTVVSRWVPLTFEGAYKRLLPSGSGGQAGQGGA